MVTKIEMTLPCYEETDMVHIAVPYQIILFFKLQAQAVGHISNFDLIQLQQMDLYQPIIDYCFIMIMTVDR